ncbi:MAG: IS630 family transposase [Chloroflexota bacterium]
MVEDTTFLRNEVDRLTKEISYIRAREKEWQRIEAKRKELQKLRNEIRLFMLRLMQGYIPFQVTAKVLGNKIDQVELRKLYHAALDQPRHLSRRALTIIYHLYGIGDKTIMEFLGVSRNPVKRYIRKFQTSGVDSLLDVQHKSIKKSDDPKLLETLLSIIHSPPKNFGYNRTSWTIKLLKLTLEKQGYKVGKNNVSKLVKNAGYRFWKAKEVLTSNDPNYKEKVDAIEKILSNLKPTERFFSIDEFGPFAVKERGGRRLVRQGEHPTVPQFQPSKGSLIVTAALELSTNQVTHFYSSGKNTDEMIKLIDILIRQYSGCRTIYLSWDHASWHVSKSLYAKIADVNRYEFRKKARTPIVKLAPLPSKSQFLNVIESVFSGMAVAIIQNSNYESLFEAKDAIDRYFKDRNEHFLKHPKRAGKKIWGKELVAPLFKEGQNCKNANWR